MIKIKTLSWVWLLLFVISFSPLFISCQKTTTPASPPTTTTVKFLGHKASGSSSIDPTIIENTLPAVQKGLKTLNGVELDLQMSLDGTIWILHDLNLATLTCNSVLPRMIILSRDAEISKITLCTSKAQDKICKLSEVINYWNQAATPFYISLHMKLDYPVDSMNKPAIGGEAAYLSKFAESLAKILPSVKDPGKIICEVYDATFCKKIHQLIPGLVVCLIKEVSFPQQINDALVLGYDGVSCMFTEPTLTEAEVTRAQKSGLIVQLWTPDSQQELTASLNLHPNFIETDNLNSISDLNVIVK
ncbi:MAG: glycerophosphodiester phosphodiesterase [Prolixibacteraceae bacterium]